MLSADPDSGTISGQKILAELPADLTEEGRYGERVVQVSADTVRVLDGAGATLVSVPIADLESARNDSLVSGGRLILRTKAHEDLVVAYYSLTHAQQFGELARVLNSWRKGIRSISSCHWRNCDVTSVGNCCRSGMGFVRVVSTEARQCSDWVGFWVHTNPVLCCC
ncbi:hypothetical protein CCB80_12375 [Armatimonadetes bacterium Uphvl-Ar1]|nr:hypothetical protein CCB80_12375 [Armatimonadetes bacterium Uphvl-Ar1]